MKGKQLLELMDINVENNVINKSDRPAFINKIRREVLELTM